jgi:SagB-type dehydrogenase family enzyme
MKWQKMNSETNGGIIKLPEPVFDGTLSVEKAIATRRSVRSYSNSSLTLAEVSQLLWAAQGLSSPRGLRTTPSAGALYPLEIYLVAGNVNGLSAGIYKYNCLNHGLEMTEKNDIRTELFEAGLRQGSIKNAPVVIIICAVYERITTKYGQRGIRYADMEAGHASQNVYLQSESLGLKTVAIGAFHDSKVKKIVNVSHTEHPLYLMPIGK